MKSTTVGCQVLYGLAWVAMLAALSYLFGDFYKVIGLAVGIWMIASLKALIVFSTLRSNVVGLVDSCHVVYARAKELEEKVAAKS